MSTQKVDATGFWKVNAWRLPSLELCTRPGLRRIYTPDSGKILVGGFSVSNEFTGEVMHYVFDVSDTGSKALRLQILTEDFETFQILALNADVLPRVITYAVVQGQIIIASPDFPTLWGLVGSAMRIAIKVESDNPSTTAIDVPRGICTAWCNRVVIASGNSLFVSDPIAATGGDARTYVAENQNQRPGVCYGIHEGAGGMLVVVTSAGTYGLDSAAAAVQIVGSNGTDWRILNHHRAYSFASTAAVRGRVFALSQDGWLAVDTETNEDSQLSEGVMPRAFGPRISLEDYRTCRMYSAGDGPLIASDLLNAVFRHDFSLEVSSWWRSAHSPTDFVLRGVLNEPGGREALVCGNGVFRAEGNFDGELALSSGVATQPKGVLLGIVPGDAHMNRLVRHVDVAAEIGGEDSIRIAVRARVRSGTPVADTEGLTIGVDSWGSATKIYTTTPLAAVRFDSWGQQRAQRDVSIEMVADGCLVRILPLATVEYSESAPERPQMIGA